jgi:hypothetical protein
MDTGGGMENWNISAAHGSIFGAHKKNLLEIVWVFQKMMKSLSNKLEVFFMVYLRTQKSFWMCLDFKDSKNIFSFTSVRSPDFVRLV